MRATVNKEFRDDFVHEFLYAYTSPGINKPYIRMAYGKMFEIIETKTAYRVTIRGETRRYNNLTQVGEFIYDQNFDPRAIYYPPKTEKQIAKEKKAYLRRWMNKALHQVKKNSHCFQAA